MDFMYRTEKPLAIALSGVGMGLMERDDGGKINNVQYKSKQNCHYGSPPPYNEYILIKNYSKKNMTAVCILPEGRRGHQGSCGTSSQV
jgi:hypothetical protein